MGFDWMLSGLFFLAEGGGHGAHGGNVWFDSHGGIPRWLAVACFFVFLVIWLFMWPFIRKLLIQREEDVADNVEGAREAKVEARETLAEAKTKVEHVEDEVDDILKEGKKDADDLKAERRAEVESEIEKVGRRAEREIELAKRAALDEVKAFVVRRSLEMAEKRIKKEMSAKRQKALIQNCIERYTEVAVEN